jgi:serine/threonine protein kinase
MEQAQLSLPNLLARTRLFPQEEAEALYRRWDQDSQNGKDDLETFARWLASQKLLTDYQASLLTRGHSEGFFLQDYKILDRIGRGRMAGVYKALHSSGQAVAIKVLPPSRAKDPLLLARFQREARLALRLKHSHVVRAYHVGEAQGLHFLVMEYLEGETLADVLDRRGKLPPSEAVRLMHQALQGLEHLYEQGLVHRDLKPSNLMLVPAAAAGHPDITTAATLRILDIGLGRELFDERVPTQQEQAQLTGAGALLGTPDYMAPEQARDARSADIRADIYSLGCVLYHMLAGRPPFPDTNLINQMVRHATEAPKPLAEFSSTLPGGLQQVVDWMLAKEPSQRYATPGRAAKALEVFLIDRVAESEPGPEPQMQAYLESIDAAVITPTQRMATPPAARASPRGEPPMPVQAPAKPASPSTKARRPAAPSLPPATKPRMKVATQPPIGEPPGSPDDRDTADVELVPAIPYQPFAQGETGLRLSRRDFAMLGLGAGSALTAVVIGLTLARLLHRSN